LADSISATVGFLAYFILFARTSLRIEREECGRLLSFFAVVFELFALFIMVHNNADLTGVETRAGGSMTM